jgi:decaprenylphospho-beta-D-ribofuranose 2-oxidase
VAEPATDTLVEIPSRGQKLDCYSGLYKARGRVCKPANAEGVRRIFADARQAGLNVTLRGGGHSFDGQALGNQLVVSMRKLDSIEVFADEARVRVGAGARWGAIISELQRHGLVPAVTVTTENATAGGTLSGDCLSRFSPAYGKEGEWIESFTLVTPGGEQLVCTPPDREAPASSWTREQRAFCGAVSGLGFLGAVVEINYKVLPAGEPGGRIGVHTVVHKAHTFQDLAAKLVPKVEEMVNEESDPRDTSKHDSIWSALDTRGDGSQAALIFTSNFTTEAKRRRMPLHRPKLLLRVLVEWLMRVPFISKLAWRFYFRFLFKDPDEYWDDLEGFTFFMDGNARAKRIAKHLGFSMRNIQQTFVVPSDPKAAGGWDRTRDDLAEWLEYAHEFLLGRGLTPTLHDVLFLPKDRPFYLSASADQAGFAVSYAFETSNRKTLERAKQAFSDLADVLWEKFGGRVYLVKNVFAREATLAEMYRDHLEQFFSLKQELDPDRILRNDFFERTIGQAIGRSPSPPQLPEDP